MISGTLCIAGSRDLYLTREMLHSLFNWFGLDPDFVIHGGATGVDAVAASLAKKGKWATLHAGQVAVYSADWEAYGKAAGPIRNRQMAERADALLLIWDGSSRGSASMKQEAAQAGIPIYECILRAPTAAEKKATS